MNKPNKIQSIIREIARNNQGFRKFARKGAALYRRLNYLTGRATLPVQDKLVYFNSFVGRSYSDSPKAIYEYMLNNKEYEDYHYVWMFRDPGAHQDLIMNRNTAVVAYGSKDEKDAIREAKYWITNYRMLDEYIPRKDQIYVQCWHGTPLKRLGYDLSNSDNAMNDTEEIRDKYKKDAVRFKYLLSPSHFVTEKFRSAWNLRELRKYDCVLEKGYPRNDRLINAREDEIEAIKEKLGLPEGKKVILYAPTWRDNQYDSSLGYTYKLHVDFDKLKEYFGEKYVILFRAHYLVASEFDFGKYSGFIWDVSGYDDINDLYLASDLLVTDYSSVIFDYANLKKPMVFYMYDLEEYRDSIRGFYLDISELPGPIVRTEEELRDSVLALDNFSPDEKYLKFCKKYNYLDDGNATERVVKAIFRG